MMPSSFVWVQFYYQGKDEPEAQPIKIKPTPEDVADLAEAVKDKMAEELTHCSAGKLVVYPPKSSSGDTNKYKPGKKLEEVIQELKNTTPPTSDDHPLIVVAPARNPTPQNGDVIQQQLPQETVALLGEMAKDYSKKRKTIVLSNATQGMKNDLMDMLCLEEKGVSWPNKPSLRQCSGFEWFHSQEDSMENREGYMGYLGQLLQIPQTHQLADVQPHRGLLSVELRPTVTKSRRVSGTTDVAIARSQHVRNHAVRNNIETLLELKKTINMLGADHCPKTIGEHIAASYLNVRHPVVSVLTDLNTKWTFFWFAVCDAEMSLCNFFLQGNDAAAEAKYLLDSLYDNSDECALPDTFAKRQSFQAVLDGLVHRRRARTVPDGDNEHNPDQGSKPYSSSGAAWPPGSNADSLSERNDSSGQQSNQHGTGSGGSAPMSMASALSLFAPPAERDVANELDLLDMLDPDEQYEIVKSFAMKHIVPHMRG